MPVAVLAFLAAGQWAAFWPAVLGIVVIVAGAGAFALVWGRDLDLLIQSVRHIGADDAGPVADAESPVLMAALGREIERLSRRLAVRTAVQAQHRRADTLILERLPDPVIVLARDRSVRRTNAAARSAFGDDLPAVLRHPRVRGAIERALSTNQLQSAEVGLRAPVPRDLYATVVPMDPPLADGGDALVVLSDRSRERVVERMRADFVANVSHELRTPLASLIGFVETLRGPAADDPPAQQRFLEIMAEQGARMNRLIDDLLSLSRIELTEHQPPSDPLDLAAAGAADGGGLRAASGGAAGAVGDADRGHIAGGGGGRRPDGAGAAEPAGQRAEIWPGWRRADAGSGIGAARRSLAEPAGDRAVGG